MKFPDVPAAARALVPQCTWNGEHALTASETASLGQLIRGTEAVPASVTCQLESQFKGKGPKAKAHADVGKLQRERCDLWWMFV